MTDEGWTGLLVLLGALHVFLLFLQLRFETHHAPDQRHKRTITGHIRYFFDILFGLSIWLNIPNPYLLLSLYIAARFLFLPALIVWLLSGLKAAQSFIYRQYLTTITHCLIALIGVLLVLHIDIRSPIGAFLTAWFLWLLFDLWNNLGVGSLLFKKRGEDAFFTDPTLQERLNTLCQNAGLATLPLFIRPTQNGQKNYNAKMDGIGPFRKIIAEEGLLDLLTVQESDAVFTHELGHLKHRHILKYLVLRGLIAFFITLSLYHLNANPVHLIILAPALSHIALPLLNRFIRQCEFQADRLARDLSGATAMISALNKLHNENRTMAISAPLYHIIYQGHPMPELRKSKLEKHP